jgi:hypothetical protein
VAKAKSIYGVHPGVLMTEKWIVTLKDKTGRSLEEWLALLARKGPKDEPGRRDWLKKEHGLGTNSAWWLAERSFGKGLEAGDPELYLNAAEGYVETMYAGKKAALRPLYDALLKLGLALGKDVKACPCQTIVPLYRKHVFAEIKPSTNSRIDFGLALGDTKKTPKRLIDTGGLAKKDRITHRFAITTPAEIDDEVKRWAKAAYVRDL